MLGPRASRHARRASTTWRRSTETQGRYGEAEPLYRRALEARERVLGPRASRHARQPQQPGVPLRGQGRYGEAEPLYRRALEARERVLGPEHPDTLATRGNLAVLLVRTGQFGAALRELRALDLRLGQWLDTEVRTTRAAAMQRQALRLASVYQDAAFSLALAHPSEAGSAFAADLVLRWKKRLAQEDAVLNNVARESRDPALLETIAAVRQGRAALSNAAFDPGVVRRAEGRPAAGARSRRGGAAGGLGQVRPLPGGEVGQRRGGPDRPAARERARRIPVLRSLRLRGVELRPDPPAGGGADARSTRPPSSTWARRSPSPRCRPP